MILLQNLREDQLTSILSLTHSDTIIALVLFILLSSIYFASASGITGSNDGSHYALTRALADHASFEISPYLEYVEGLDYSFNADRYFTDRPPGAGMIAAVFYRAGKARPPLTAPMPTKHDVGSIYMAYALMVPALSGAAVVAVLYLLLRQSFARSPAASLAACLALGLGTILWKYSSVLFSYAPSALVVILALYLVLRSADARPERPPPLRALVVGLLLGFAPSIEYTNALFSLIVGLYIVAVFWKILRADWSSSTGRRSWLSTISAFALGALLPIVFLLIYNTANFGGPFELSSYHVDIERWPNAANMRTNFATPLLLGLKTLLLYHDYNQGLFALSPVALFGLIGLVPLFRFDWRKASLLLGIFIVHLCIFATNTSTANHTGGTFDSRYLTAFISLWFLGIAFWYDAVYEKRQGLSRLLWSIAFFGLLAVSFQNEILHIAYSLNYGLLPANFITQGAMPHNLSLVFGTVFRNLSNLPVLWLIEALGIGLVWLTGSAARQAWGQRGKWTTYTQSR